MLENIGNAVIFYAFYTEDGALDTGLTVTADVAEVLRDGTATKIVNDGACTEVLSLGLYRYLLASGSVDAAAEYIAIFSTTDGDTDQKDIPALWAIDRAGTEKLEAVSDIAETTDLAIVDGNVDSILTDTATTIPATLAGLATTTDLAIVDGNVDDIETILGTPANFMADVSGLAPTTDLTSSSDVWTYGSRTLTQSATSITAAVSGSSITDIRGNSWDIDVTELTLDSNLIQFTIKRSYEDADASALLMIDSDTGLLYLNGAAGTAGDGSLSLASTTLTIVTKASATAQLPPGTYVYGIQSITAAGAVAESYGGTFVITADRVRATT